MAREGPCGRARVLVTTDCAMWCDGVVTADIAGRGRGVVATKRLAAGDLVLTCRPLAAVASATRCSRCFSRGDAELMRCSGCRRERYCSAVCQKADWKAHHRVECKAAGLASMDASDAANGVWIQVPCRLRWSCCVSCLGLFMQLYCLVAICAALRALMAPSSPAAMSFRRFRRTLLAKRCRPATREQAAEWF
jgi:hypothetical protein